MGTVEACREMGIGRKTGYRWRAENGGLPPPRVAEPARSSRYLSLLERQRIATLRRDGLGVRAIAERIGRAPSTVSRELRRNTLAHDRGYDGIWLTPGPGSGLHGRGRVGCWPMSSCGRRWRPSWSWNPRVLVLDEPTSALDPAAAEDVLAAITRLVHDLGITAVIAEHRMERVVQYADRLVYLPGDGTVVDGAPAELLRTSDLAPPVVELGRLALWDPLPLSVRDARRIAGPLREQLADIGRTHDPAAEPSPPALSARGVVVRYGDVVAVRGVDLDLPMGQVTALMGRNGSGKSSLLWALQGSGPRQGGMVDVTGRDPRQERSADARKLVGMVPQTPSDLVYLGTVAAECEAADDEAGAPGGSTRALLNRLISGIPDEQHPRDLSEGQRLALVLAIQTVAAPSVVLLDEPTRGLDYHAKQHFADLVTSLAAEGRAVVVATHDVEFVAGAAHRVVVMAEGEIVADGPTAEVLTASPAFAPQVAKTLAPQRWLTVADVSGALEPMP